MHGAAATGGLRPAVARRNRRAARRGRSDRRKAPDTPPTSFRGCRSRAAGRAGCRRRPGTRIPRRRRIVVVVGGDGGPARIRLGVAPTPQIGHRRSRLRLGASPPLPPRVPTGPDPAEGRGLKSPQRGPLFFQYSFRVSPAARPAGPPAVDSGAARKVARRPPLRVPSEGGPNRVP